ncbi:MAG: hypothetical protein HXK70_03600 [Clostridiales bacterium]|nr:hypothetical protein [Clostridiales bacterium]
MQKFGLYGYIASKHPLTESIIIYVSIEIITYIIIEAIKYLYLNKLFIRLQKDQ